MSTAVQYLGNLILCEMGLCLLKDFKIKSKDPQKSNFLDNMYKQSTYFEEVDKCMDFLGLLNLVVKREV